MTVLIVLASAYSTQNGDSFIPVRNISVRNGDSFIPVRNISVRNGD